MDSHHTIVLFPVEDDANKDAWKMIADPIIIPYDPNGGFCYYRYYSLHCLLCSHVGIFIYVRDRVVSYLRLRDAGLLSEDLKDPDTGKKVSDDEVVRVTLSLGELLDIKFPVEDDANKDAWKMIADPIIIPYDPNGGACEEGKNCWCDARNNVFKGLITNPTGNYTNEKSKMYLMNNKEGDPEKARMYSGNYFDVNGVNLRVQSCDVNPSKVH